MVNINEAGQRKHGVPVTRRSHDTCDCPASVLSLSVPTFRNDICFRILLWQMGCASKIKIWSGDHKTFRHGSSQIVNCNFCHTITLCHFAAFRRQCLVFLGNYVTETYFTDLNNLWTRYTSDIKVDEGQVAFWSPLRTPTPACIFLSGRKQESCKQLRGSCNRTNF